MSAQFVHLVRFYNFFPITFFKTFLGNNFSNNLLQVITQISKKNCSIGPIGSIAQFNLFIYCIYKKLALHLYLKIVTNYYSYPKTSPEIVMGKWPIMVNPFGL